MRLPSTAPALDLAHQDDMRPPQIPADESARMAELVSLSLLDTDPEERFDRVTRLAQRLFDVPIAFVSLVDDERQWFKSRQGIDLTQTSRHVSFCGHAILEDEVLQVVDARADDRFHDNPLVIGAPSIRFYAGHPITGPGGAKLGTLSIMDTRPRTLSPDDIQILEDLAHVVEHEISVLHMATVDHLTGLSNRRGFDMVATKALEICRRQHAPATLLFADLDGLKQVNDELGHEAGDRMLRDFAALLERTFRVSDVVARVGGDEFVVLLTGASSEIPAVENLREAIEEHNAAHPDRPLATSTGVAVFDPSGDEPLVDLVGRADQEMYRDKRQH